MAVDAVETLQSRPFTISSSSTAVSAADSAAASTADNAAGMVASGVGNSAGEYARSRPRREEALAVGRIGLKA